MIRAPHPASIADVAAHYDELDVFYRELWGDHVHHGLWLRGDEQPEEAVVQLVAHVAAAAHVGPGSRVCDVGCGYGAPARYLVATHAAEVVAYTVSAAQHAYARHVTGDAPNPVYHLQDWLANDLPAASFDAVIAIESIAHMADKRRFFAEAARVLRPGGRLVACAWLADEAPPRWAERHLLTPICQEGRLPDLSTATTYRHWAEAADLRVERFDDLSPNVWATWPLCIRRFLRALASDPRYLRHLLGRDNPNRVFAVTLLRIWLAYRLGVFRYGFLVAERV